MRVRFAPSPTGYLHIGGLRTALYNYLVARRHGGTFLLRIEDTDQERFVADAEEDILESLRWAGLAYEEGPVVGGPHEPYYQSQRKEQYHRFAEELIAAGHAYYAFDTVEELEAMRTRQPDAKYDARTRLEMTNSVTLDRPDVEERIRRGDPYVVRLKVPLGDTVAFDDLIRGRVAFETDTLDDQVLLKSDGMPTYHLANVVDDHLMEVTHVIRGEEWLPSTPKHILLYRFLGWEPPRMAHLPLILSPTGGKLSKRNAAEMGIPVSVHQYREEGYEPEAVVNFLAFLGWNPGTDRELFSLQELVEAFSLERVGSSGVQFNLDKLRWYNEQVIRGFTPAELVRRARPYLEASGLAADETYLEGVARLMQERISFARELASDARYFFEDPDAYEEAGVKKRWKDDSAELVTTYADRLEALATFEPEELETALRTLAEERNAGAGRIIHPTRLAVSGVSFGPSLFDLMALVGREACVRRMRRAAAALG